jgi:hypothetical protein
LAFFIAFVQTLNNENNSSERFSYLKGDYQGFITSLKELDWDSLLANKNIDQNHWPATFYKKHSL